MKVVIYDEECYPNCFLLCIGNPDTRKSVTFEISERKDDRQSMFSYLRTIYRNGTFMVSFNGLQYDWPLLSYILNNKECTNKDIYKHSCKLIEGVNTRAKQIIPQIDLFKIHHYDNVAKMTSLKVLEFNMRMDNIEDLPYAPGSTLTSDEIDNLRRYVKHDVKATAKFYEVSKPLIDFRVDLTNKYKKNFLNHNDVRIGKEIFVTALEKAGVQVYENWKPRQTKRDKIIVKDILVPYIQFNHPELKRVYDEFREMEIVNTKGDFRISADLDGFRLDYGTGGLHGSVTDTLVKSDDTYVIENRDVSSYYPNLAIKNRFYPEHLTEKFCDVYEGLYEQRKKHKKGTAENAAFKLALNGTYGSSNSEFSPFFDSQFTMSITLNGELLLSMLVEKVMEIESVEMLNVNTDGLCYRVRRDMLPDVDRVCREWEQLTQLELETEHYNRMYIRDVNSFILDYE
jgi:hypothetical protein